MASARSGPKSERSSQAGESKAWDGGDEEAAEEGADDYGEADGDYRSADDGAGASARPLPPITASVFELAQSGQNEHVLALLDDKSVDVNSIAEDAEGKPTLLHIAAGFGNVELTRSLLERGANVDAVDARGASALFSAVRFDHLNTVEVLVYDGNASIELANGRGETLLHICAEFDHVSILELLLELMDEQEEVSYDPLTPAGRTPLQVALVKGSRTSAVRLIEAGADVTVVTAESQTPLHIAAQRGMESVTQALLAVEGIELDVQDSRGATPLCLAARRGHLYIVDALVEAGADVNAPDLHGWTPLHWAARWGHGPVAVALVSSGADAQAANNDGKMPLDVASQATEVAAALGGRSTGSSSHVPPARGLKGPSRSPSGRTFVTDNESRSEPRSSRKGQ